MIMAGMSISMEVRSSVMAADSSHECGRVKLSSSSGVVAEEHVVECAGRIDVISVPISDVGVNVAEAAEDTAVVAFEAVYPRGCI